MSDNLNEWVIVATFADESAADAAVKALKAWDKASDEIKLGAIGTIYKQDDKVKTHVGRKAGKGAKVGAAVGVIAGILSGGLTLVGGVVAGGALGSVAGTVQEVPPPHHGRNPGHRRRARRRQSCPRGDVR